MPRSATRSEWGSWDASDLDGVEVGDFRAEIACPNDGVLLELGNEDPVGTVPRAFGSFTVPFQTVMSRSSS